MNFQLKPFTPHPNFSISTEIEMIESALNVHFSCPWLPNLSLSTFDGSFQILDELWKTTCFELFLKDRHSNKYFEFNFSPSSAWNCYSFEEYRSGMKSIASQINITSQWKITSQSVELNVEIPLNQLMLTELDFNLTSVIEINKEISYWSVNHPQNAPDFHDSKVYLQL